jgi:hypothetical protein
MPIKTWEEMQADWDMLLEKGRKKGFWWCLKKIGNMLDDPLDWVKEKIHGARIGKYEINISVLMKNRKPNTWDIIRKWLPEGYPNSDPEDRRA